MSGLALAALIVPIVGTTIIGPWVAYHLATRTNAQKAATERRSQAEAAENERARLVEAGRVEDRRLDREGWQAIIGELRIELNRLKDGRQSDEDRIVLLGSRLSALEIERDRIENEIHRLQNWANEVVHVLRIPEVAAILQAREIIIPPPPIEDDDLEEPQRVH